MSDFQDNPVDKEYASLHNDIEILQDQLATISAEIRNQDISNYPIFVASPELVDIGKTLFTRDKNLINWNIGMSTLENLVVLGIVSEDKVDDFRRIYKDPDTYFSFLVMREEGPEFIFIKRPTQIKNL